MSTLGDLVMANPALLFGAVAALLPILIHLLLRPRPRRTRFPALALLHAAFASGARANRLRNLLLMLVRAALLTLAALLLAGPTCSSPETGFVGTEPLACAIVLDNSASTTYRLDADNTILSLAHQHALALLKEVPTWPAGSAVTVCGADNTSPPAQRLGDTTAAVESLRTIIGAPPHARPLGDALLAAGTGLREATQPQRRLVIFTDGAAHAWQNVTPAALAGIDNLAVRIIVPDTARRSNLTLFTDNAPPRIQPAGAPLTLAVTLTAEGVAAQCRLVAEEAGQSLTRQGPVLVPGDDEATLELVLPPRPAGPHALTLRLDPADRLEFDQQRWLAVQTGPQPLVWLIAPSRTAETESIASLIFKNLLAPAALPPKQQLVNLRVLTATDIPDARSAEHVTTRPALIVILAGADPGPARTATLLNHAEHGSTLLLVPGDNDTDTMWPGLLSLLTPAPAEPERTTSLTAMQWTAPDAAQPELDELTRCAIRRRLRLGALADGAEIVATYADGLPAIIQRRHGAGRLLLLTTSPAPAWSDLGIRAAGLLTWLHHLVEHASGPRDAVAAFTVGQHSQHRFSSLPAGGLAQVILETASDAAPLWLRLTEQGPERPWPTDRAGVYAISAAGHSGPSARYVVNWPREESRLAPITLTGLQRQLGLENVILESAADRAATPPPTLTNRLIPGGDLRPLFGGLLLFAFAAEMLLSARRAGRSSHAATPPEPPATT